MFRLLVCLYERDEGSHTNTHSPTDTPRRPSSTQTHKKQTHGTRLQDSRLEPNKPALVRDGDAVSFGDDEATRYVLRCESAGEEEVLGGEAFCWCVSVHMRC